jgi:FAD:protein FMN transferase
VTSIDFGGSTTTVSGALASTPGTSFVVDVFGNTEIGAPIRAFSRTALAEPDTIGGVFRACTLALTLAAVVCGCSRGPAPAVPDAHHVRDERLKMGTRFEIQVVAEDDAQGRAAIDAAYAEIDRLEALLSEWRETSEISAVNRAAGGQPVVVGPELLEVVERALELSQLTAGAFDITFASCGRLWSIEPPRIPSAAEIAACLPLVGSEHVVVSQADSTIRLDSPATRIGIAGIGKGYGVERAARVLESHGISRYLIAGAGDIRVRGSGPDRPWRVGVAHPRRRGAILGWLELASGAITTSGDYERYFEQDGVRYHHILDPRTGEPARRSVAVTVIGADSTVIDALATGLFVLGPEDGLALAERVPDVEALLIDPDLVEHRTSGFPQLLPPS